MSTQSEYLYKLFTSKLFAMACLSAAIGLGACQPEGPAEKAGQKVDKAVENAAQLSEQSAEKAAQKIEVAKESVAQQAEQSADTSNDALEKAGKQIDQAINNSERRLEAAKDKVVDSTKATGQFFDDSVITAKAKTALLNDEFLKLAPIEVSTVSGAVTLRGTLDSEQLVGRAIGLVSGQEHVKSVQNELSFTTNHPSKQ
ncbi:MAG: hypothetical protein BVN35_00545 [Proteobacteria bacterium ST_bin11]|nr:MAG: hypothetical protein BVN35_00545 [Proteobacteria bacterium ST_bin11]